jgi:hypothetical protein
MFKHAKMLLAFITLASIALFISCQEQQPVATPDVSQMNLSKVSTFVMPPGAAFVSASLEIYSWSWMGTPHDVDVHSVTADWTCPAWDDIHSSFDPTVITSFDMSGVAPHWNSLDISATVQAWLTGGTNYGLMLMNQDAYANADKLGQFLSNDYIADPTLRPYLKIVTTAGTIEVEPSYDTYISSLNNDLTYCDEEKLYIGYIDLGTGVAEKRPLIRFDIQPMTENCETAYAFGDVQFCGLPGIQSNNWGWTRTISGNFSEDDIPIYAGAAHCDPNNGKLVGTLSIDFNATTNELEVDYNIDETIYSVENVHMWIGPTYLPVNKKGEYKAAPGQYNYNNQTFPFSLTISETFYIAVHFDVCWYE